MTARKQARPSVTISWPTLQDVEAGAPEVEFGTVTDDGLALVEGDLRDVDGQLVLTRVEFKSRKPGEPVRASTLRQLKLDQVLQDVRRELADSDARAAAAEADPEAMARLALLPERARQDAPKQLRRLRATAKAASDTRRRGDDHYRLVAMEYVALTRRGEGGRGGLQRLAAVMAERMGEATPRSRDNVRDWVAIARQRDFLAPGQQGRGGAEPGPRLYES